MLSLPIPTERMPMSFALVLFAVAVVQKPPPVVHTPSLARPPYTLGWMLPPGMRVYSAQEAVMGAADRSAGLLGEFAFVVRATGWKNGKLYLNSEHDYRDPRNLSIAIEPEVAQRIVGEVAKDARQNLVGRIVVVRGMARTTRIDFTDEASKPSGKYYFQTQVSVGRPEQLRWVVDLP